MNKLLFIVIACLSNPSYAHEPLLLTQNQFNILKNAPRPDIFSQITLLNGSMVLTVIFILTLWLTFNLKFPQPSTNFNSSKINWSSLSIRIGLGTTLIMLGCGMLPQEGVEYLKQPALFASEFQTNFLPNKLHLFSFIEIILGAGILIGLYSRVCVTLIAILWLCSFIYFGKGFLQYSGFYISNFIILFSLGAGDYSIVRENNMGLKFVNAIGLAQCLTGLNFIYSSLSIKWTYPNVDIGILTLKKAFTFGIPYDYFALLMMLSECLLGIFLILGYRLRYVSSLIIFLFLFLSINLSENILAHNFIYGILGVFIITNGIPLFRRYKS